MPTKPQIVTLTNASVDILNVIRNNATQNYKDYVPQATSDAGCIRKIGAIIMDYPSLQNEFLSALVNRIGKVVITSKMYENPLANFKQGLLEFGETIEEIFVNIAKPFQYDPEGSESTQYKREMPDVRSAFHIMNYQKYYKTTVQEEQLRQAFLSWQGITDLISKVINAMYTGASYDEFLTMKYLVATHIINGQMYPVTIPEVTSTNMKEITSTIKGISNSFEFLSSDYNLAGVQNNSVKEEQYMLINSKFDAAMNVEVLASSFNMDKAEFLGHRVLIDSFGKLDNKRLAILFADDSNYVEIPDTVLAELDKIPAIIVDKSWFMVFDIMFKITEKYNGEGMYWNYWYHTWKSFSISPFSNNALFIPDTPSITSVAITPATCNASKSSELNLTAKVVTQNFAPQTVNWSVKSGTGATVSKTGHVILDETATGSIVINATSTFDKTKIGTCTITID